MSAALLVAHRRCAADLDAIDARELATLANPEATYAPETFEAERTAARAGAFEPLARRDLMAAWADEDGPESTWGAWTRAAFEIEVASRAHDLATQGEAADTADIAERLGVDAPLAAQFGPRDDEPVMHERTEVDGVERWQNVSVRGLRTPADVRLEIRVDREAQRVADRHAAEHTDLRVPYCRPCTYRAEWMAWPPVPADHPDAMRDDEPDTLRAAVIGQGTRRLDELADGRLRAYLERHRELPLLVSPPELGVMWETDATPAADTTFADLVDGVLPQEGVGLLSARNSRGKSFIALDLALTIATGRDDWHGRAVTPANDGVVLYVAGEGARGIRARRAAWLAHAGEESHDLALFPAPVNLFTGDQAFAELLDRARRDQPDLIVLDTLQTMVTGADQNSAADMGIVMGRARQLQRISGGTVLLLAHTGKSDIDTRGSSALEDDADFVLGVAAWEPERGRAVLRVRKMKDGELGDIDLGVEAAHGSLVIVNAGAKLADPTYASSSKDERIRGAFLRARPAIFEFTRDRLVEALAEDAYDQPIGKTSAGEVLADMIDRGQVERHERGRSVTYSLVGDGLPAASPEGPS